MEEIKQNEIVADEIKASATSEENDDYIIEVDNVSMEFFTRDEKIDNLKELIIRLIKGKAQRKATKVLHDVSFKVKRGESIGLIGHNGAGKSTLLKLIAEIYKPTKGTVKVNGKVAPLLNLGAGFDYESSGKENVYLNGAILGYSRKEIAKKYEEIVEFAELKDYMHIPLKNYSSGMVARLGFAIATMNIPDILIIDEILAVGDYKFQQKSFARMQEMINSGATVVFVSHSIEQVKQICKKALWLDHGNVVKFGPSEEVCQEYMNT